MRKRELVANLLNLSCVGCVALPYDAMGLSVVCDIVVFPAHTHSFCFLPGPSILRTRI